MSAKHFIDDPTKLVRNALQLVTRINPRTTLDLENKVLYNAHAQADQVALISGGGSGHEPAFTGFVGPGFLSASVAGTIFASPSSNQVLTAIQNVQSSKGVVVVVMNYTGDVLNFGVAIEKAKAINPSRRVEQLVVGDDVGVPRSKAGKVGRRGVAGTVLVQKILGALSALMYDVDDLLEVGKLVCDNLVSVGASLNRVHVPGRPTENYLEASIAADEIELGMGIHNETGSGRVNGLQGEIQNLVSEMLRQLLDQSDTERAFLKVQGKEMILLLNNLGSLSTLECAAIAHEVIVQLEQNYDKKLVRVYCGTFMTSLNGPGFSISLLNVVDLGIDQSMQMLLDASCDVPGWQTVSWVEVPTSFTKEAKASAVQPSTIEEASKFESAIDMDMVIGRLSTALQSVIDVEPEVTEYDNIVGDGDCGTTLKRGAQGILDMLSTLRPAGPTALVEQCAVIVGNEMDGTSGALFSIFLNALTVFLKQHTSVDKEMDTNFWAEALTYALDTLSKYTPARVGDRTLLDALIPFVETLKTQSELEAAGQAALQGAVSTKHLRPKLGRTVYVGDEQKWLGKIPDPGAWGVSRFLAGLSQA